MVFVLSELVVLAGLFGHYWRRSGAMPANGAITVVRVRLRRARVEGSIARLRMSHLLSSASLQPPAMPPSAILMVRAMDDPLPGRITRKLAPGSLASPEWESAAQDRLEAFYGSAWRPIRGTVPSSADAVLFADRSELLACLARDLATGAAIGWWWQSILRRFPSRLPGSWATAWAEEPRYIPAALEYLERQHLAVNVLQRIAPVQAWNLLMVMLRAFDLPGLIATRGPTAKWSPASAAPATPPFDLRTEKAASLAIENARSLPPPEWAGGTESFPWEPHVSRASTPSGLGYERQSLLGVGLLLHRSPQVPSTTAFALRFRAWVLEVEAGDFAPDSFKPLPQPGPTEAIDRNVWGDGLPKHRGLPNQEKGNVWVAARGALPDFVVPGAPHIREHSVGKEGPASPLHSSTLTDVAPRALSPVPLRSEVLPGGTMQDRETPVRGKVPTVPGSSPMTDRAIRAPGKLNPPQGARRDSELSEFIPQAAGKPGLQQLPEAPEYGTLPTRVRMWEGGELTHAGGVLYLIHFLRHSELLRHFDSGLGGWELLELLGRCLLDQTPSLADDAIWAALAHLDGRSPSTPPGSAFKPQRTYAAPPSWLERVADRSRFVRFRTRGFEIWSAEGFLVLESNEDVLPSGDLRRLTRPRRRKLRRPARVRPIGLSPSRELRRFLHFVLPYARWRLDRALGGAGPVEALLRTGRLYLTKTHVDLVMPMKEISLPVRLAGLDANPGWVPQLSRVVTFHFVQEAY